jgi:hypothetical protein
MHLHLHGSEQYSNTVQKTPSIPKEYFFSTPNTYQRIRASKTKQNTLAPSYAKWQASSRSSFFYRELSICKSGMVLFPYSGESSTSASKKRYFVIASPVQPCNNPCHIPAGPSIRQSRSKERAKTLLLGTIQRAKVPKSRARRDGQIPSLLCETKIRTQSSSIQLGCDGYTRTRPPHQLRDRYALLVLFRRPALAAVSRPQRIVSRLFTPGSGLGLLGGGGVLARNCRIL